MRSKILGALISLSLSFFSVNAFADDFYLDASNPQNNSFIFHSDTGSYVVFASSDCNGKTGGRICITIGEGTACNIDAPVDDFPTQFQVIDRFGKPETTIIIRVSPNNAAGIACGKAKKGV